MRLTFSVLWFDDNEDYFDSLDLAPLKQEIRSWGFVPKLDLVKTPDEFISYSPFANYDIIVIDRNLEGYDDGQKFIANLRSNAVYTEVIFYTTGNTSDLWKAIFESELEGVFVSSRNEILTKISKVGRQSIQKVLDLENMRGIVMAEVGELDLLLDEIITSGAVGLSENQRESMFNKFHKNAVDQNAQTAQALERFRLSPTVDDMLEMSDSDKRWQSFNRLRKSHDKLKTQARVGAYVDDVLRPRNFLAHGKPLPHPDGGYVFHYQGREYHFDEATSLKLRQTILSYKVAFWDIIAVITPPKTA